MFEATTTQALVLPLETLMQLGLYFILGIYAIFSAILHYHWNTYGTDKKVTNTTLIIYFTTTVPLIIVMALIWLTI